jgi:aspartate/glutamate racemase
LDTILVKGCGDMGEKTIDILGVTGPEATADLYYRIVKVIPVKRGQARALLAIMIICLINIPFIPKAESKQ